VMVSSLLLSWLSLINMSTLNRLEL
jgi:hypothetical protein